MYICICKGITEEQLKNAASMGGSDQEILKRLGVGSDCGVCLITALNSINPERPAANNDSLKNKK